jgi:LysM repeat protein
MFLFVFLQCQNNSLSKTHNMKIKYFIVTLFLYLLIAPTSGAQMKLPVKKLGDTSYYCYTVKNKETIYSISKELGISKDDIILYNPSAAEGLQKKQILFFPINEFSGSKQNQVANNNHQINTESGNEKVTHTVKEGETLYGLSKSYGVSQEAIIAANPQTNDGLTTGMVITIPLKKGESNAQEVQINNEPVYNKSDKFIYHTIIKGETLYSLSKKYNTTIESILSLNPGISPSNFKADEVIKISPNAQQSIIVKKKITKFYTYVVKKNDTFNSIASANGIKVADLQSANPGLKKPKEGKIIYIPKTKNEPMQIDISKISENELESSYVNRIDTVYNTINNIKNNGEINIGIILPFQLQKSNPPKQALLYREFYKGFLLAIDSVKNNTTKKINIDVYDTEHNLNKTDSILSLKKLTNLNVIIAPGEPQQLSRINVFGENNKIPVINCFSVKNEDYLTNPQAFQVNIPATYMASKVSDWFDKQFNDYTVIFLDSKNIEDNDIFSILKQHIVNSKHKNKTLTVADELSFENLTVDMDPGTKYVFIPTSSDKELISNVIKALKTAKTERYDCDIALLGYPEYILYLKDLQDDFQTIDTYVFTRFFNSKGYKSRDVDYWYKKMYREEMMNTVPTMGLYGYDTGMFLINSLSKNNSIDNEDSQYDGIQTDFRFKRISNWGGFINNSIEIIHFTPSHTIETIAK